MFFPLTKILGFFALPSNLLITLALLGAVMLMTRFARLGRRLLVASVLSIAVAGLSPLGNLLILPLEQRFPPWDAVRGPPDGIVVLGGSINPELSLARGEVALNESAERVTVVAELARRYPQSRIVFSGGNSGVIIHDGNEAEFALKLFRTFGIDPARVTVEDRSRNTAENAMYSKQLVAPKPGERWLLVTSAYHMPRSIAVFRQVGFDVEAYPVDYRTRGWIDAIVPIPFESSGDGLRRTDTAMREWVGLLAYWVTGRSSALFPGPRE